MRDFVDGEEQVLVCSCSDDVCSKEELPGEESRVAEEICAENLKRDDEQDDVFRQWLWAAQLGDLDRHELDMTLVAR